MDMTDFTKLKIVKEKRCQMMLPKSDIWNAIFSSLEPKAHKVSL